MRCTLVNKIHRAKMGLALVKMCCPNAEWLVMIGTVTITVSSGAFLKTLKIDVIIS